MGKWNDKKSWTLTFEMQPNEQMADFVNRMNEQMKKREEAMIERIKQLFDEHIKVGGEKKDEAYCQILQIFSIGYQCGWNDHYQLFKEKEGNQI